MRLGNGTAPSVFLDSLPPKHWAVLLLSLFSIMVLSSVCLFTFARDATKRLTCLSASSFPNMSVSAHPDVNTEKLSCWISSPWKEFSKSSIFRDLKCCLRVYERPKCREKSFDLKIPVCMCVLTGPERLHQQDTRAVEYSVFPVTQGNFRSGISVILLKMPKTKMKYLYNLHKSGK